MHLSVAVLGRVPVIYKMWTTYTQPIRGGSRHWLDVGNQAKGARSLYIFFSAHKPTLKAIQLEMPVALHPDMQTSHRKCQCLQSLCLSPHFLDFKNNFSCVVLDFLKKKKSHPWFYGFDWLCTARWLLGTKLLDAAVKLPLFLSVYGAATLELRLPKKPVRRFPSFCPL